MPDAREAGGRSHDCPPDRPHRWTGAGRWAGGMWGSRRHCRAHRFAVTQSLLRAARWFPRPNPMETERRPIAEHAAKFAAVLPGRTLEVRRWLSEPDRALQGIWFLPFTNRSGGKRGPSGGSDGSTGQSGKRKGTMPVRKPAPARIRPSRTLARPDPGPITGPQDVVAVYHHVQAYMGGNGLRRSRGGDGRAGGRDADRGRRR